MSLFHISDELPTGLADSRVDIAVLVVSGELDYSASPLLSKRISDQVENGRRHLVVDLSMVGFIDSTAIGVLVGAVVRLRETGRGSLRIVCAEENERVLRIFDIGAVASLIPLHSSREVALSELAKPDLDEVASWVKHTTARSGVGDLQPPATASAAGAARRYAEDATVAERHEFPRGASRRPARKIDELA